MSFGIALLSAGRDAGGVGAKRVVGERGFEPRASASQTQRSARLSYTPVTSSIMGRTPRLR